MIFESIFIALKWYFVFVAAVFLIRFIIWIVDGLKSENAKVKARQAAKENKARFDSFDSFTDDVKSDNPPILVIKEKSAEMPLNRATIAAYEKQKDIILERISDVEETLDLAPRGKERENLQVKRLRLYNDLANIENKIYRVSK